MPITNAESCARFAAAHPDRIKAINREQYAFRREHVPEYNHWQNMKKRCRSGHRNWGGRGIRVCAKWESSFTAFLIDMGPRPSSKHSIERVRNNEDYDPENCIWAVVKVQNRNRRDNRLLEFNGKVQCLAAWAEDTGIPYATIYWRYAHGRTPAEVLA